MNKTELAKLLIKHPEIRALYESQAFDTSTINKVIAEEIVREQEDGDDDQEGKGDDPRSQTQKDIDQEIADDDPENKPIASVEDDIRDLKNDIADAQTIADLGRLEKEVLEDHPKNQALIRALKRAKKRIESGSSSDTSKEDAVKKEMIQSIQSEVEFLKTLLNDPDEAPLDKEEYKSTIDEYTKKLEQMGVAVAKTDSLEDDKAFVQSLQSAKPEIEQAASAVSTAEEDEFSQKFSDLDAAIMASLQKSKDAAKAANDNLDLSDIEIDDEGGSNDSSNDASDQEQSPIDKALQWLETDEASQLFQDPGPNWISIESALTDAGISISPFGGDIDPQQLRGRSLDDVRDYLKSQASTTDDSDATPEGTQAAVEAIESGNTNDVTNINSSDVDAAKKEKESEIEASPEMKANAEELKTKVEKNKMPNEQKLKALKGVSQINKAFEKAKANIENRIKASKSGDEAAMAQLPEMSEILGGPIRAMQETMETIASATSWDDLANAGIWSTAIKTRKEANQLPDFEQWKQNNEKEIQDKYEELRGSLGAVDISSEEGLESVQDSLGDAAIVVGNAIQNSDASGKESGEDVGGAEVQGQTDLETIEKILPQLKDKLPNLFKFDGFVKNLAQALMNAEPSSVASDADGEGVDASGTANSSDTNLASNISSGEEEQTTDNVGGLEESLSGIYLTEEEGVVDDTDEAGDEKTGKPLEVADAETLRQELEQLRQVLEPKKIKIEDLITPELKQALDQEPTEETSEVPSVEEAAEEGQNAAQDDADQPDLKYEEMYAGFKEQMDEFFSLDGKNDGFMDQFLLKYQAAKLAELIGTLDDIIRGDVPKDGEDNEGEARALSTATQQADNQLEEAQGQEISEKGQLELKTRLVAMLKGLKSLKAMMNSYKQNATRSSANPKLDGSALKKSLQRYMSNLQINIKAIVETCYIEHSKLTQTQSDDVDLNEPSGDEATPPTGDDTNQNVEDPQPSAQNEQLYEAILEAIAPALDGVYLMEDAAREEKMEIVNTIYGQMKEEIYLPSMQSALERSQKAIAMKNAKDMMELAKKEEFVALFPTFVGSFGGKPQTIDQAVDAIDGLLKEFIETMKKVIVLAKGATIDETTLAKVIEDLSMMSLMMQNYFGVKSLLDDEMQARVEKMLAQRAENQSLSDEAKPSNERSGGLLGKAKELAGKGLEKLKQLFGWLSEETLKLLAKLIDAPDLATDPMFIKFVEPFGELIVKQGGELTAKAQGTPEVKQIEELMVQTLESKSWFDSLNPEQQSAVTELVDAIYKERDLLQELDMSAMGVVPSEVRGQISSQYQMAMILVLKKMDEEKQTLLTSLMSENENEFVSYLVNQHQLRQKMGEEKAKQVMDLVPKSQGSESSSDSEKVGKSEEEMQKLIDFLKSKNNSDVKRISTLIERLFEEEDHDKAFSLLVYYVYHRSGALNEADGVKVEPNPKNKVNKFLDTIKSAQFLTQELKDFARTNSQNLVKLLMNDIVMNILKDTDGFIMKTLGSLLSRSPSVKKDVEKISGKKTDVDTTTTDSDDVMPAEVEFDDEDETNDPSRQEEEEDDYRKLESARVPIYNFERADSSELKSKLSDLGASIDSDDDLKKLQKVILNLSNLFNDIRRAVINTRDSRPTQFDEGIKDSFKSIKGKVKSSANKFMSRFDLPKELKDDLKYLKNNPTEHSGPEVEEKFKSDVMKAIAELRNTGVKFSGGLDVFLWTLYLDYGNIDETAKTIKDTRQRERGYDLRYDAYHGGYSIDESNKTSRLEESLKPIIEKMLKERNNH